MFGSSVERLYYAKVLESLEDAFLAYWQRSCHSINTRSSSSDIYDTLKVPFANYKPRNLPNWLQEEGEQRMKSAVATIEQVADGANNAANAKGSNNTNNRSTTEQWNTPFSASLYTRAGESSAPPQKSPHLSDESVDLMLSEEDKYTVVGEVHRLETVSLVVQV